MSTRPQTNKERKKWLADQGLSRCRYCDFHRSENASRRRPRSDRHKNRRAVSKSRDRA